MSGIGLVSLILVAIICVIAYHELDIKTRYAEWSPAQDIVIMEDKLGEQRAKLAESVEKIKQTEDAINVQRDSVEPTVNNEIHNVSLIASMKDHRYTINVCSDAVESRVGTLTSLVDMFNDREGKEPEVMQSLRRQLKILREETEDLGIVVNNLWTDISALKVFAN